MALDLNKKQETPVQATPTVPGYNDTPISSDQFSGSGTFKITPPKPDTKTPAMLGAIQSSTDAFTENLKAQSDQAQKQFEQSGSEYQAFLNSLRGEAGLTQDAYKAGGVNKAENDLNDINQKIRNEQRALENTVRDLQDRGGGLKGGMQAEIDNARRQSLRTQADLYVIQQGIQGKYDSAKAIADRAVSAFMESQNLKLDALKFNYEENKDLFTKAEQRQFEVSLDGRKRALDQQEADLKEISDLSLDALQNGAPPELVARMRASKSPEDALLISGGYIGRLERAAKLQSIQSSKLSNLIALAKLGDPKAIKELGFDPAALEQEAKNKEISATELRQQKDSIQANETIKNLVTEYKALLDDVGFEGSTWGGANLGKFDALRGRITTELKKAETLGTLDVGVLQLVDQLIGARPEKSGLTQNWFGVDARRISSQLGEQLKLIDDNIVSSKKRIGDPTWNITKEDTDEVNTAWDEGDFNTQTSTDNGT